jgi:ABC-type Na+ efflux pump permease subunit
MKKILEVIRWEFWIHFRSRAFLVSTLFSPFLLSFIIWLPGLFIEEKTSNTKIIGLVNFAEQLSLEQFKRKVSLNYQAANGAPKYIFSTVRSDSGGDLGVYLRKLKRRQSAYDSINALYVMAKRNREMIFKQRPSATKTRKLKETYREVTFLREQNDLAFWERQQIQNQVDSVFKEQTLRTADARLLEKQLDAYLFIPADVLESGQVEYHSILPLNREETNDIRLALDDFFIHTRMDFDRISPSLREKWLKPTQLKALQIRQTGKQEFNYYVHYFGPIIIVFLLFIAIFTSSGLLFSGILNEKENRIVEILVSSLTPQQLMAGKLIGLGSLGLVQVFFWIFITLLMVLANAVNLSEINFLNVDYTLLFLLYFVLGYFFFASIYIAIASIFKSEKDAQQINQFIRIIAIFPVLLAILVLNSPDSFIVKVLSYIPFLTPTFYDSSYSFKYACHHRNRNIGYHYAGQYYRNDHCGRGVFSGLALCGKASIWT